MSVEAIRPAEPVYAATPVATPPPAASGGESFAATLARHLDEPRASVDQVRAEVAALRDGGFLRAPTKAARAPALPVPSIGRGSSAFAEMPDWLDTELGRQATGNARDPYGWRALSRDVAEAVIGPGYGALFERQIQQESGFAPDVVYGMRVSTAGAEGIAQLMPQYYPGVERTDPRAALVAGAKSMQQYLTAWDGDVRKALASYNAGLGRVRSLVQQHGDRWESALPAETRQYLASIVGNAAPRFEAVHTGEFAVFGGRGPGGVLSMPLGRILASEKGAGWLDFVAAAGEVVRSPADGTVLNVLGADGRPSMVLDHGNGWQTVLEGLGSMLVTPGALVRRSDPVGTLGDLGWLRFGVTLDDRRVDPSRYLLGM